MEINKLILGDNLEILKTIASETIDLIYLDPPFFSNRNYEVIWGDAGEIRSFQDRWSGGIDQYIRWLRERVEQMYRILKPTGSMFLHCDWHANAYIRVLILDRIFGEDNFLNEIIWGYDTYLGRVDTLKHLPKKHDAIFVYTKSKKYCFNKIAQLDNYEDTVDYKRWRKYFVNGNQIIEGQHPQTDLRFTQYRNKWIKDNGRQPIEGEVIYECKGEVITDNWTDIKAVDPKSRERIGYPTQKPEILLQRIIEMSSNEDDIVLDPFVGGGTTIAVADRLKRKWLGIDQSVAAVKVTEMRLDRQRDIFSNPFTVQLHKYDYDTLRYKNAFLFESWIVQQFGGVSNAKQRNDFGLDGKMPDYTPIQVKRSENIGRNVIDNFFAAVQRSDKKLFDKNVSEQKPVGYVIAFSFGKGAVQEVARLQNEENIIIRLVKVEDIVPIAKKPSITVEIRELSRDKKGSCEIEFTAFGQSEAGIEFYSWDFDHDTEKGFRASIIIDKIGKQSTQFKAGMHVIAVKVVDNDGLENIEVLKLKVNGKIERT